MRTIAIEGMKFRASIGVYEEEQSAGNEIVASVYLHTKSTATKDDLGKTFNYEVVHEIVQKVLSQKMKLLETACEKILAELRKQFPSLKKIVVRVEKIHPPLSGVAKKAWVQDEWVRES